MNNQESGDFRSIFNALRNYTITIKITSREAEIRVQIFDVRDCGIVIEWANQKVLIPYRAIQEIYFPEYFYEGKGL